MNREELKQIIKRRPQTGFDLFLGKIKDSVDAFNDVVQEESDAVEISIIPILASMRAYITLGSRSFSHNYDTTLVTIFWSEREIQVALSAGDDDFSNNQLRKFDNDDSIVEKLADIFSMVYVSDFFKYQVHVIEMLEKEFFDLTVFSLELFRYLPSDLHISIKKDFVRLLKQGKKGEILKVTKENFKLIHQLDITDSYNNKYGVVNGFVVQFLGLQNDGSISLKLITQNFFKTV